MVPAASQVRMLARLPGRSLNISFGLEGSSLKSVPVTLDNVDSVRAAVRDVFDGTAAGARLYAQLSAAWVRPGRGPRAG